MALRRIGLAEALDLHLALKYSVVVLNFEAVVDSGTQQQFTLIPPKDLTAVSAVLTIMQI